MLMDARSWKVVRESDKVVVVSLQLTARPGPPSVQTTTSGTIMTIFLARGPATFG